MNRPVTRGDRGAILVEFAVVALALYLLLGTQLSFEKPVYDYAHPRKHAVKHTFTKQFSQMDKLKA